MIDHLLMPDVILSASYDWILTNPSVCVHVCVFYPILRRRKLRLGHLPRVTWFVRGRAGV